MRREGKGVLLALLIFVLYGMITVSPVYASEGTSPDFAKRGTVTVQVKTDGIAIADAGIALYRVADMKNENSGWNYYLTPEFENAGVHVEQLNNKSTAKQLWQYVLEYHLKGNEKKTNETGCVRFENLPLGIYLVVQAESVDGFSDCTPFFIALPSYINDEWIYEVDATPKVDVTRLMNFTVQKIWNDDGRNRPDCVEIQLYKGNTVCDKVVLDDRSGWTYTWTDLEQSDEWSVKEVNIPKGYTPSYQRRENVFTITNTAGLIQTGQINWPIPVLAVMGMLFFAAGWWLIFGKKDQDHA
ncbi:MAG: Cna B-type domain-containing protein [Bariatricus sp.]